MYGLKADDFKPPDAEVWPENMVVVETFAAMRTQWRFSHFGATGLDYGVLPVVLRLVGVPRGEWTDVFEGIRAMETVELISMRRQARVEDELDD